MDAEWDRPTKVSFNATWVLEAARQLAWGEKAVWLKIYALQGPEGCYLTASQLGVRLGMTAETVETYRRRLRKLGLVVDRPRPGSRSGRGWYATLPPGCVPPGRFSAQRAFEQELIPLVKRLDDLIQPKSESEIGPHGDSARMGERAESEIGPNGGPGAVTPTHAPAQAPLRTHTPNNSGLKRDGVSKQPEAGDGGGPTHIGDVLRKSGLARP